MIGWITIDDTQAKVLKKHETMAKVRKNVPWIPVKKNKINVQGYKTNNKAATCQEALKAILIIGQAFSLLPVDGICSKNASNVRFRYTSWKCAYACISFLGQLFIMIMCVCKAIYVDLTLKATSTIIFYGTTLITMAIFLNVARNWPKLIQDVTRTEELDPNFDDRLTFRCNMTCTVILSLALMEHILSLLLAFAAGNQCFPDLPIYEGFVRYFYPWVFNFLPYSTILGLWTQFLHFQSTFIWNFSDLFVICMSYYLTSRLQLVNKKLTTARGKYLPELFWRSIREEYGRATQLVRKVDEVISGIVFMSFAINLFFICYVLFNTLENGFKGRVQCVSKTSRGTISPLKGYEAAAYYLFSLVYLITRSIAVSLIAAQVNTASLVPAPVLYDIPSPVYCTEVQRFLDQVNGDKIALSGLQFFSVTRGLLLTVAGTIVTYELVMVQFNAPSTHQHDVTTILPLLYNVTVI